MVRGKQFYLDRLNAKEKIEYVSGLLYLDNNESYHGDMEGVIDDCLTEGVPINEAIVYLCEENRPGSLTADFFVDCMPEDMDEDELPQEYQDLIDAFNDGLKRLKPLSFSPSDVAVRVDEELWESRRMLWESLG